MPDPLMSEAIAEAYASAPVGQVVWETIEIWHPVFTAPIYVVRDYVSLDAKIEATAARNAGTVQTFAAFPFDLVPPDLNAGAVPRATLEIDNVSREIGQALDRAVVDGRPTEVIWRSYLSGNELVGPEHQPPLKLQLNAVSSSMLRVRAGLGFRDLVNAAFPTLEYDVDTFEGLVP